MTAPFECPHCLDDGIVCEEHPQFPWEVTVEGHRADCGRRHAVPLLLLANP